MSVDLAPLFALVDQWSKDRAAYPVTTDSFAPIAATAVRLCEDELRAALLRIEADELVSVSEAAALLGVTRQAVLDRIKRRTLPAAKVGRQYLIERSAVTADKIGGDVDVLTDTERTLIREAVDRDECCDCHEDNDTSHLFAAVEQILAKRRAVELREAADMEISCEHTHSVIICTACREWSAALRDHADRIMRGEA